ncbi:MAG: PqqD family protein [Candidatus Sulfotelmatobacter sp.]
MPSNLGEQIFARSQTVVSRVIAGETLIVPVCGKVGDLASIYSFNGSGSLIWQLLEAPKGLEELIGAVEREYAVGQDQVQKDVKQFLDNMRSIGLVEVCQRVALTATQSKGQMNRETAGSH